MKRGLIVVMLLVLIVACTSQKPLIEVNQKPYDVSQPVVQEVKQETKEEVVQSAQQEVSLPTNATITEGKIVSEVKSEPTSVNALKDAFSSSESYFCVFQLQDPLTLRVAGYEIWLESSGKYRTRTEVTAEDSYTLSGIFDGSDYYYWDSQTDEGIKYSATEAEEKKSVTKNVIIDRSSSVKCKKINSVPAIYMKVPTNIKFS